MPRRPKPSPTPVPAPTPTPAPTGFVTMLGGRFSDGPAVWPMDGASVLFALDNPVRDCDAAKAAGLNTIRIVNFLDEGAAGNPYDTWRWLRVDNLITAAKNRGLKVILDLSTFRNFLAQQGKPYDLASWSLFLEFVGNKYRNETAIAFYSLAGEPEPKDAGILASFYAGATAKLKSVDTNHLVTCGGLLQYDWGGVPWQAIFRAVDFGSIHVYSPGDEAYVPAIASYCASIGKPWIVEEFGFPQSDSDAKRATEFTRVYNLARANSAAGVAFWNLGPELKADTYDVGAQTPQTLAAVVSHG